MLTISSVDENINKDHIIKIVVCLFLSESYQALVKLSIGIILFGKVK